MDFRQLEYILEIAKENNISKASKNLFISQSALNQQLLKLEKELGTQLFHRSRTDWHPTEAGELYLAGARQCMMIRKDTYNRINDITHSKKTELRIGLTPVRGIQMFSTIYPRLHSQFPDLIITPLEIRVQDQQAMIASGDLDLGFVTLEKSQRTGDHYVEIGEEEMITIVPKIHPVCSHAAHPGEPLSVLDLRLLQYEPFILMFAKSTIRLLQNEIFERSGIEPNILMEVSTTSSIPEFVTNALCCSIIPRYYVHPDENHIGCFVLPNHPSWDLCVTYRRGSYLSDAGREFIRLAREYWKKHLIPIQTN